MSAKEFKTGVVPGVAHPVTAKLMEKALIKRDNADYEAYRWILDLFAMSGIAHDIEDQEPEFYDRWKRIHSDREEANDTFMKAAAGRLEDGRLVTDVHPFPEEDKTDGKD